MRPKDWFTVGVRLFGVWMILDAIHELLTLVEIKFELLGPTRTAPNAYLLHTAVDVAVAIFLFTPFASDLLWPEPTIRQNSGLR